MATTKKTGKKKQPEYDDKGRRIIGRIGSPIVGFILGFCLGWMIGDELMIALISGLVFAIIFGGLGEVTIVNNFSKKKDSSKKK